MSAFDPLRTLGGSATLSLMFTYDDIIHVRADAPAEVRPGEKAWVIGITIERSPSGRHFEQFPSGTVNLVEFEDGDALDIHESMIETAAN